MRFSTLDAGFDFKEMGIIIKKNGIITVNGCVRLEIVKKLALYLIRMSVGVTKK